MKEKILELIEKIYIGNSVKGSINDLKAYGIEALKLLLGIDEKFSYPQLPKARHPKDAYDDLQEAVYVICKESKDYYLELLNMGIDQDKDYIFTLTWIAGSLGYEESINALIKGLKLKNQYVRWACCNSLLKFQDERIILEFIDRLKDRSSMVRGTALDGIIKYKDKRAIPNLEKLLNDRYPGIRKQAKKALELIVK